MSNLIISRIILIIISVFLFISTPSVISFSQPDASAVERAKEILRELDDIWRGSSSYSVFTMKVKTANYSREMKLEGWSKGKEKSLVRILKPLKEKGTATLKSENNVYSYLPRTDRTIRLTSGMMMGSWMGSHFTNDDLIRESRMEDDYDPSISFEGERDGMKIMEFTLTPKPDAPVVWGKIVAIVKADGYMPLKYYYYDEDMNIARTFFFSKVEQLAGRPRPKIMKVIPADKPEEYTEIIYEELDLGIPIDDEFFSIARLKRF
jgi:outer membrane lipoprotein-sorting protein